MESKFYLLFGLCILFMIIALPIGVGMFICVGIWYVISQLDANKVNQNISENQESELNDISEDLDDDADPDFVQLFNDEDFIREQENLK